MIFKNLIKIFFLFTFCGCSEPSSSQRTVLAADGNFADAKIDHESGPKPLPPVDPVKNIDIPEIERVDPQDDCDEVEKRSITFAGSKGDDVPGYLWLPDCGSTDAMPAVLGMYGISGDKDSSTIAGVAESLAKNGFVIMTLDWPGTGDRKPSIDTKDRIIKKSVLNWTTADYRKAVDFLVSQDEVDGSRIGYVGVSMGAMTGISYVASDRRIKAMVPIVPIPNPLWGIEAPSKKIQTLQHIPVYCMYTKADLSDKVCEKVTGGDSKKKEFAGDHELKNVRDEVIEETTNFLKEHL